MGALPHLVQHTPQREPANLVCHIRHFIFLQQIFFIYLWKGVLRGRENGVYVVWMAQYFLRRAASALVAREEAGSRGTPDPVIPHCARRPPQDTSVLPGSSVKKAVRSKVLGKGLPGGIVDKIPPLNAGDTDAIPGPGGFHMPWNN